MIVKNSRGPITVLETESGEFLPTEIVVISQMGKQFKFVREEE